MQIDSLIEIFEEEINVKRIKTNIEELIKFHRVQGSTGYHQAVEYVINNLKKENIGYSLHKFPADGKWEKWGWKAPIGWNIKSGTLKIVSPVNKIISDYLKVPMSVITHSNPCDFKSEIIDIGKGETEEEYKEAKGKIALITASPRNIFSYAAKYDVKGLIIHPNPERLENIGEETIQYDGYWPVGDNLDKVTSGFSISDKQYQEFKNLLDKNNNVKVHLNIDAEFVPSSHLEVLDVLFEGSKPLEEEIVFIAHLCHPAPSANDNASGSSTLLELVKALKSIVTKNSIQLDRSIRFLWVPEFSGTIPWLEYFISEFPTRKIIACINLDMVGESPFVIGSPLDIIGPSIITPSILQTILKHIAKKLAEKSIKSNKNEFYSLNFRMRPFGGGSDHQIFNDSYFGIPSVMLGHDDPYHHSTADTLDKVEPLECRSVVIMCGVVSVCLASLNKQLFDELVYLVYYESFDDLLNLRQNVSIPQQLALLKTIFNTRFSNLEEVFPYSKDSSFLQFKEKLKSDLNEIITRKIEHEKRVNTHFKRTYEGPTSHNLFKDLKGSEEQKKSFDKIMGICWGGVVLEILNLIDLYSIEEAIDLLTYFYPELTEKELVDLVVYLETNQIIRKQL